MVTWLTSEPLTTDVVGGAVGENGVAGRIGEIAAADNVVVWGGEGIEGHFNQSSCAASLTQVARSIFTIVTTITKVWAISCADVAGTASVLILDLSFNQLDDVADLKSTFINILEMLASSWSCTCNRNVLQTEFISVPI